MDNVSFEKKKKKKERGGSLSSLSFLNGKMKRRTTNAKEKGAWVVNKSGALRYTTKFIQYHTCCACGVKTIHINIQKRILEKQKQTLQSLRRKTNAVQTEKVVVQLQLQVPSTTT